MEEAPALAAQTHKPPEEGTDDGVGSSVPKAGKLSHHYYHHRAQQGSTLGEIEVCTKKPAIELIKKRSKSLKSLSLSALLLPR